MAKTKVTGGYIADGAITSDHLHTTLDLSTKTLTIGATTVSGHLIPDTNITYDLGSSTYRFRDIYLDGTTINLGGTELKKNSDGDIEFKSGSNFKRLVVSELEFDDGTNRKKFKIDSGRIKSFDSSGVSDTADKISLASNTTDDLGEGSSNLYFTIARARSSFSASTGIAITDGAISAAAVPNSSLTNSSVTINSNSLSLGGTLTLDTDDIGEGSSNLYYTTARWDTKMAAADTDDLSEGSTNLYFTNTRAREAISVSGNALSYNSSTGVLTANYEESPSFTGNITVSGTVDGRDIAADGTKLDGIESGATADQTQAEINALGITATGLSGTPNITVGTIDSGAITITTTGSGDLSHFNIDGADANYDFRSNSTSGYTTTFNMDNTGLEIGHNSSGRNLALRTDSTDRIIIGGSGGVNFQSNNLTSIGTINSGAITSTGAIEGTSFSDGTISGITFIDEDSFATNSATRVPTQQSVKAYVDAEVAGVVDSAPAALNTLNELAAALGDDANFSTTTSTALGNRLRVDTASQGLTGTQQANAITNLGITATKAELNYVDGVTSSIQDQLDGKQASGSYLTGNQTITLSGDVSGSGTTSINVTVADDSHNHVISNVDGLQTALDAKLTSSSGLNASNLTSGTVPSARLSLSASDIPNLDASKITSGRIANARMSTEYSETRIGLTSHSLVSFTSQSDYSKRAGYSTMMKGTSQNASVVNTPVAANYWFYNVHAKRDTGGGTAATLISYDGTNDFYSGFTSTSTGSFTWAKHWTDRNDGPSSGLDADLLDGQHGSYYAPASTAVTLAGTQTITGTKTFDGSSTAPWRLHVSNASTSWDAITFQGTNEWGDGTNYGVLGGDSSEGLMLRRPHIVWNSTQAAADIRLGRSGGTSSGKWVGMGVKASNVGFLSMETTNVLTWDTSNNVNIPNGNLTRASNTVWDAGNDGSGSTLDADLLDGQHGSYYAAASHNHSGVYTPYDHFRHTGHGNYTSTTTSALLTEALGDDAFDSKLTAHKTSWSYAGNGDLTDAGRLTELAGTSWLWWTDNSTDNVQGNITGLCIAPNTGGSAGKMFVYNNHGSSYNPGWREIWTSLSDGSGSGLDADLLDGLQASQYLRSDANDTFGSTSANQKIRFNCNSGQYIASGGSETRFPIEIYSPTANGGDAAISFHVSGDYAGYFGLASDWNDLAWGGWSVGSSTKYRIWHSGNDGSGSGLDADLLDGLQLHTARNNEANKVVRTDTNGYIQAGWINTTSGDRGTTAPDRIYASNDGYIRYYTPTNFRNVLGLWWSGNDGSGSGLDADLLDGVQGSGYYRHYETTAISSYDSLTAGAWTTNSTSATSIPYGNYNGTWHISDSGSDRQYQLWMGDTSAGGLRFRAKQGSSNGWHSWEKVWTDVNDGSGSGLDADTVDGIQGASFLRSDTADTYSDIRASGSTNTGRFTSQSSWGTTHSTNNGYIQFGPANSSYAHIYTDRGNFYFNVTALYASGNTMWHAGNDGSGSGLDADTVDGQHLGTSATAQFAKIGVNGAFNAAQGVLQVKGDQTMNRGSIIRWANDGGGTGEYIYSKSASPYDVTIHSGSSDALQCPNTGFVRLNHSGSQKLVTSSTGVSVTGDFVASGNVTAYSDRKKKKNIRDLESATTYLNFINPKRFAWKDTEKEDIGFIAQDVEEAGLHEFVSNSPVYNAETALEEGTVKTLDYGKMVSVLWKAVQEQQETIEKLTSRINDLEKGE